MRNELSQCEDWELLRSGSIILKRAGKGQTEAARDFGEPGLDLLAIS
jgi:hypothetical protein